MARMLKRSPKKPGGPTFEIMRSQDGVPSSIEYGVTTGIEPFDDLIGPIPFGRLSEFYGLEYCGKTALAIRLACRAAAGHIYKVAHKRGGGYEILEKLNPKNYELSVVYIDNENSLDESAKLMVDGQKLEAAVGRYDTLEDLFLGMDGAMDTVRQRQAETKKEQFMITVVDTFSGTSSRAELDGKFKEDYPRHVKQLKRGFRTMVNNLSRYNNMMIATNQASEAFGDTNPYATFDSKFKAWGGRACAFYASIRVFMHAQDEDYKIIRTNPWADGILVNFKVKKNRLRRSGRSGRMVLITDDMRGGLHPELSLLETFIRMGYIEYKRETKEFVFKFTKHGIEAKTFETLPGRQKDPRIRERAEFISCFRAHREDFMAMWEDAMSKAFVTTGLDGVIAETDTDNGEDVDPDFDPEFEEDI